MSDRSCELARAWIECWIEMDLDRLRSILTPDFVHTSPFGRLEGREPYLEAVAPMARKSVAELRIVDVIGDRERAAVWFENHTPEGVIPTCDWVSVAGERIREIRSFYDPALVRGVLSSEEQQSLDTDR